MEPGWLDDVREDVVSRKLDLGEVLQRVVDAATEQLNADRGTLYLVDHARRELVSRVAHLPELREIRWMIEELRVSLYAHPMRTRYPVSIKRIQKAIDELPRT